MKNSGYELTPSARLSVLEIWNYLAENATIAIADEVLAGLETSIQLIIERPFIGHVRSDLTRRDYRFFRSGSYWIVYRPRTAPLKVYYILHASRDVRRLLK